MKPWQSGSGVLFIKQSSRRVHSFTAYMGEFLMGELHYLLEESNSLFAAGVGDISSIAVNV